MPPKGGGFKGGGGGGFKGGGFKGGGGHHHHHHHGGGGIVPGPMWWGGGYPFWYDSYPGYSEIVVTDPCPDVVDPVLGVDGKKYLNACKANQAGVAVAKKLGPGALKDYVTINDYVTIGDIPVPKIALLAGVGIAAYMLFFKKSPRERSASRVRTAIARRR